MIGLALHDCVYMRCTVTWRSDCSLTFGAINGLLLQQISKRGIHDISPCALSRRYICVASNFCISASCVGAVLCHLGVSVVAISAAISRLLSIKSKRKMFRQLNLLLTGQLFRPCTGSNQVSDVGLSPLILRLENGLVDVLRHFPP